MVIGGPGAPADVAALCGRVRAVLERSHAALLVCHVAGLTEPDVGAVDVLARLQLTARRLGRRLRLCGASGQLRALLEVSGLAEVVPLCPDHRCAGTARWPRCTTVAADGSMATECRVRSRCHGG